MNYLINLEYKPERSHSKHWAEFEVGFPTCKRQIIIAETFPELIAKVVEAAKEHGMLPADAAPAPEAEVVPAAQTMPRTPRRA